MVLVSSGPGLLQSTHLGGATHHVYLLDLAPSDHHIFQLMGRALVEQRFHSYKNLRNRLDEWCSSTNEDFLGSCLGIG